MQHLRCLAFFALGLFCVAAISARAEAPATLTILTSPANEIQGMALVLANQAARQGAQVRLLLCDAAGDIALAEAPDAALVAITPRGQSVLDLLQGLRRQGGTVEVCALYLPNRALTAGVLADGIGVARPADIAALMVDSAVKVFVF